MAAPLTIPFGHFYILVSNGSSPETFNAPCGITSKGFNQTATTQDTTVPDCEDPDAPAYIERAIDALSSEISGDGVLDFDDHHEIWQPWYASALPRTIRIGIGILPPQVGTGAGGFYEGSFLLTGFNMTADRGQKMRGAVTLVSDGEWSFEPPTTSPA